MNLQIVPGYSAGGTLRIAIRPAEGALLVHEDVFSWGPLVPFNSIQLWRHTRESYFRALPTEGQLFPDGNLLTRPDIVRNAKSITLWVGTGLNEQLFLVWFVQLLRVLECEIPRLRIIQFSRDSRSRDVVSVGILSPQEMRAHPAAAPLLPAALAQVDRAWAAVTAPDPSALLAFLEEAPGPLPLLSKSLRSLFFYFPGADTGLNHWEETLLARTAENGPSATRIVGSTMADSFDISEVVADSYLFTRLRRLGDPSLPYPLVTLTGAVNELRGTRVHLTDAGRAVLEGRANFFAFNPVEDWAGGVHLDSARGWIWTHHQGTLAEIRIPLVR